MSIADAGGREKDRRCQTDLHQRPRFEGWLPRLVQVRRQQGYRRDGDIGIAPLKLGSDADPHAWQSVANAKIYVGQYPRCAGAPIRLGARLSRQCARPIWQTRRARPRGARGRRKIPEGRRKVISTHDAFGYFATAYGLEFIAPVGVSTESEPSARDIAAIITQIKAAKIPAVFSGKCQRSAPDPPDIGRDRRQGRRYALFGQLIGRKGRCSHLH
jgi:hypothetical protein